MKVARKKKFDVRYTQSLAREKLILFLTTKCLKVAPLHSLAEQSNLKVIFDFYNYMVYAVYGC